MAYKVIVRGARCWCPNCRVALRFRNQNGVKRKNIGKYCEFCGIEIEYPKSIDGEVIFDDEASQETLQLKEQKMNTTHLLLSAEQIAEIREDERNKMINVLMKFFPDEPCNYNGMDELTDCEWCSEHCPNHTIKECWEHAIKEKWYER